MELRRTAQPLGAKADPVGAPIHHWHERARGFERGLQPVRVIVGRRAGHDFQDVAAAVAHDAGLIVGSEQPPVCRAAREAAILHELTVRAGRIFNDRHVVDQRLAGIEQAEA